jgi:hypothetical protein
MVPLFVRHRRRGGRGRFPRYDSPQKDVESPPRHRRAAGADSRNTTGDLATLAAIEMALELTGVSHGRGGVDAAMDYLVNAS